mmetsp:Transcript_45180/g.144218  ORF Transcript_45180/g.144218 Transcript_45180/m.144218 type:complete len:353 (-) Transcript_45180:364-1422(-)
MPGVTGSLNHPHPGVPSDVLCVPYAASYSRQAPDLRCLGQRILSAIVVNGCQPPPPSWLLTLGSKTKRPRRSPAAPCRSEDLPLENRRLTLALSGTHSDRSRAAQDLSELQLTRSRLTPHVQSSSRVRSPPVRPLEVAPKRGCSRQRTPSPAAHRRFEPLPSPPHFPAHAPQPARPRPPPLPRPTHLPAHAPAHRRPQPLPRPTQLPARRAPIPAPHRPRLAGHPLVVPLGAAASSGPWTDRRAEVPLCVSSHDRGRHCLPDRRQRRAAVAGRDSRRRDRSRPQQRHLLEWPKKPTLRRSRARRTTTKRALPVAPAASASAAAAKGPRSKRLIADAARSPRTSARPLRGARR